MTSASVRSPTLAEPGEGRRPADGLIRAHDRWRGRTINLIASENVLSPAVRAAINSDLLGRYADYPGRDPAARRYRGTRYAERLEERTRHLAARLFDARYVEIRPISGHLAGLAVVMGLCHPGDLILELGREGGGHREAGRLDGAPLVALRVEHLPFDPATYNIDASRAAEMIRRLRPRLVILGSSNFLFPHPVKQLASAVADVPGCDLAYDGSHVMGLLAAGLFQRPLAEGADLVFGSTHKTLPGPQGGVIFSNRDDLMDALTPALVPGLITNHHPFRIPGLLLALEEASRWGSEYGSRTIANTNALGAALEAEGLDVVRVGDRYSESHTLLANVSEFRKSDSVARELELSGIIVTSALLPAALGSEGIRLGTQEVTRLGAGVGTMGKIARLIADRLRRRAPLMVIRRRAAELARSLGPVQFTWEEET